MSERPTNFYQAYAQLGPITHRQTRIDVIDRGLLVTGRLADAVLERIPELGRDHYRLKIAMFNSRQQGVSVEEIARRFEVQPRYVTGLIATVRSVLLVDGIAAPAFAAARKEQKL